MVIESLQIFYLFFSLLTWLVSTKGRGPKISFVNAKDATNKPVSNKRDAYVFFIICNSIHLQRGSHFYRQMAHANDRWVVSLSLAFSEEISQPSKTPLATLPLDLILLIKVPYSILNYLTESELWYSLILIDIHWYSLFVAQLTVPDFLNLPKSANTDVSKFLFLFFLCFELLNLILGQFAVRISKWESRSQLSVRY